MKQNIPFLSFTIVWFCLKYQILVNHLFNNTYDRFQYILGVIIIIIFLMLSHEQLYKYSLKIY